MKNKDRVWAAIEGRPCGNPATQVDYTPLMEEKLCRALNLTPDGLFAFSGNCIRYASSLGNVEEYFNKDIPFDERHETAIKEGIARYDPGEQVAYDAFGVGWNCKSEGVDSKVHPLSDMGAYSSYHWPMPTSKHLLDPARQTVERYGAEDFILGFQHIGLFERAWTLRGYENLMCDLLLEPDFVEELLENILNYKLAEAQLYVDAGVDAVRIGDDWGLQTDLQMAPETWRKLFKPRYAKLYAFYKRHGMKIFQHSCGAISAIVGDLAEIGLDVLHPIQPMSIDIEALFRSYGNKLTFWGGIDTQSLMPMGAPEEVEAQTARTAAVLGKNSRYIAGPSQELMSDVPVENVRALVHALKNIRTSPVS